jgi:hypothetical protein
MLQERTLWCGENNDPEGENFPELEYIPGIQRYLEVDADDATRSVDAYDHAWWQGDRGEPTVLSYAFEPYNFLALHRPQVSNVLIDFYSPS